MRYRLSSSWLYWGLWVTGLAVFSAFYSRDAAYDVVHYHLHNGWSALNGRLDHDLAPAEMHSFLNPTYNIAVFWLVEHLPGRVVAALLGAIQSLLLPALYYLSRNLIARTTAKPSTAFLLIIALAGFFAAPHIDLFASLRNDWLFSLLFITSLLILLPKDGAVPGWKRLMGASFLLGLAFGAKLTNGVYVIAFITAVLVLLPGMKTRAKGVAFAAIGGTLGTILTLAPWSLTLWEAFQNPLFPLFDGIFQSPEGPGENFRDQRYAPETFGDALILPFQFLFDGRLVYEFHFFDLRFLMAYLSMPVLLIIAGFRARQAGLNIHRHIVAFALAALVLMLTWLTMFSIQRYGLAIWMLGPLCLTLLCLCFSPRLGEARAGTLLAALIALPLVLTTYLDEVWRVPWRSMGEKYVWVETPKMVNLEDSIIIFSGKWPSAFMASELPDSAIFTHAAGETWSQPVLKNYRHRIVSLIENSERPIFMIVLDMPKTGNLDKTLNQVQVEYGLIGAADNCQALNTSFDPKDVNWVVCPMNRSNPIK